MKRRIIIWIFCFLLITTVLFSTVPIGFGAPSIKTDADFFAKFDLSISGMEAVKSAVDSKDYTTAKSALLVYYKGKFADYETDSSGIGGHYGTMAMLDTFAYFETPYASQTIAYNNGEFRSYSFGRVSNTSGRYVLSELKKTSYSIEICSKEYSTASMRPVLHCYNSSGTLLASVNPTADATVKYGSKSTNYGTATTLVARHDATSTLPYSTNSQRAYLKFTVPSGTAKTELVIYARINGGSSDSHSLDLWQFEARATDWTESNLTWERLVSTNSIGHYSYDGVTGGFDWSDESGTPPNDWVDMHCRLHCVQNLFSMALDPNTTAAQKEKYLNKGKSLLFDFIQDADVTIGWPDGRDKETPFRLNYAPFFYKTLLENNKLSANENATFLKWIYDEVTFLCNGGNLFDNSGTSHKASAYTNHAFHHISGLYTGIAYFPEFKNNSSRISTYRDRWNDLINDIGLLGTDGSYNEGVLGAYTQESLNCVTRIAFAMKDTGDTASSKSKEFTSYMIKYVGFLMDMTFPNNSTPATGQRAAAATKTNIQKFVNALSPEFYDDPLVQELKYFLDSGEGTEPDGLSYYPIGQFYSDRTDYTTGASMIYLSARAAGHYDHPDALAILLYNGGRYLLAETAQSDNTTKAHNTISINSLNQSTNLKPMTYKNSSTLKVSGNKGTSSASAWTKVTEGFDHYRELTYLKGLNGMVIVTDKALANTGSSSTKHTYVQNWHTSANSGSTIASDSYDTGKTAFSSGSNLIIAQVSSNSITGTVSENHFSYTQKASGTVTYQTVLYPVKSGATATVQPAKLSLDANDSVARATKISISDSANPDLKTLYFYQSFESSPASRAFSTFTTNGATAVVAQNASANGIFASMVNGSTITVTSSSIPVLQTGAKVTDISATLKGSTLTIESSDESIASLSILVNFGGITVNNVTVNGETVPFYISGDSTIVVGQQIIHFFGDAMGLPSNWTTNHIDKDTFANDTANGLLSGTATGNDPYLYTKTSLNHYIKSGDVVEIRLKTTVDSTTVPNAHIYFQTSDGSGFAANVAIAGKRLSTYADGEFSTLQFTFPAKDVGKILTVLRLDPFSGDSIKNKTFVVDYIYVGHASNAPSNYNSYLLFDFGDDAETEDRHTAESYGDRDYSSSTCSTSALSTGGVWYMNGNKTSSISVAGETVSITCKPGVSDWAYLSTANCLKYHTQPGDIVQVRLKVLNMEVVPGKTATVRFYANNSSATLENTAAPSLPVPSSFAEDTYYVLQANLTEAMVTADYLTSARVQWTNLQSMSGGNGKVVIDYIYVGPPANAPMAKSGYTVIYNDGFNLVDALQVDTPMTLVSRGGSDTSVFSVTNGKLTIQNKLASGETYHYFTGSEFYLEAGKEYRFSCTTSGTWGSQVEAYIKTGSTHTRMTSNNMTFTPVTSGYYQLRFDVNVAGQTHTFENVRIEEATNTLTSYGMTPASTHSFGEAKPLSTNGFERPGYVFKGWSTTKAATTATYTDGQSLSNVTNIPGGTVTLYAVWEKNPYPSTWLYQLPCRTLDGSSYRQHMSYVIKTRGGKIIVIDGGYETENGDAEYLLSFLKEITGKAVPNVDAWFFTHPHEDHVGAIEGLAKRHASEITVDTIYYNFPSNEQLSKYAPTSTGNAVAKVINNFEDQIKNLKRTDGKAVRTVEILARHENKCMGSFTFDTLSIDVLMTCEDMFAAADSNATLYTGTLATNGKEYSNKTIKELLYDDFGNNISCVLRMTVAGENVLFLGDLAEPGGIVLKSYHDTNAADGSKYYSLKSDMVQMAHHGQTGVPKSVYTAIDPEVCLWPAPDWVYTAGSTSTLTTHYTRQWVTELCAENYVSSNGPQVFEFADHRSDAPISVSDDLKPLIFDAAYYANRYGDVKNAFGTDAAKLYDHFINNGIEEGRCGSPYFDIQYYIYQNSQALLDECKGDYVKGFAHFVNHVYDKNEFASGGKKLSPIFDCKYYKDKYTDIAAMSTEFEALKHFVNTGYSAGRVASEEMITLDNRVYHTAKSLSAVAATCTATGTTAGKVCTVCGEVLSGRTTIAAKGHTVVIDKAVAATCTSAGLTEGKHCSVCNAVLTAQTTVAATGHSYTYKATKNPTTSATGTLTGTCSKCSGTATVTLPKLNTTDYTKTTTKAPTCTATGTDKYTWKTTTYGGFYFNVTTAAKGHTEVVDKAVAPTCTATGLTEGKHCSVCNAVITAQTTVAAKGHTEVIDKAVAPTCTATGLTEGKHCSVCNTVLTAQTTVAALGHDYNQVVTAPTCTAQGYTTHTCSRCANIYKDGYTAVLGHSYDSGIITTYPTLTAKGIKTFTCLRNCGTNYTQQLDVLRKELYFDFRNRPEDQSRYHNATYNFYNFDDKATVRWAKGPQFETIALDNTEGVLVLKSANADHTTLRLDSAVDSSNIVGSLHYIPTEAYVYQIRFKMVDFDTAGNPSVKFQFWSEGSVKGNTGAVIIPNASLTSGEYVVLTGVIPAEVRSLGYVQSVRVYFTNVQNAENKQGTLTVDYIYVGTEENLPTPRYTVTFQNHDGTVLQTGLVHKGEIPTYAKVTPAKAPDSANHYTFKSWDKALTGITADTTFTAVYTATAHNYSYTTKDVTNHTATCACGYSKSEAHSYTYKATKNPTTSATGTLTGTCSKCSGTTTVILPKLTTTDYTKTTTKAPTCTATGTDKYTWKTTTYGSFYFNVTTAAKGHTEVIDKAVAPTCTATGLTEGKHCSVCNAVITAQTTVAAKGHTEVVDKAVAPTCTITGLTEGKHCSVCKAVLTAQTTVAALGHDYNKEVTAPTCTAQGYTTHTCSRCANAYKDSYTAVLGHSYDGGVITTYPTLTAKGIKTFTCLRNCGTNYTQQLDVLRKELYFDFRNRTEDQNRYQNATYNFYNFDDKATVRWAKGPQFETIALDNTEGVLVLKSANADHTTLRLDSVVDSSNIVGALHYVPAEAYVYQIRFKMTDFDTASNPSVKFQFWSEGSVKGNTGAVIIPDASLTNGEYVVLTGVIPAEVRSLSYVQSVRVYFTNVQNAANKQGTLTVDYIYVGREENLPTSRYTVTFQNSDGTVWQTSLVHKGEIPIYTKATPTKAPDSAYHYTFKAWDKTLTGITADTTFTAVYTATAHSYSYAAKDATNHTATCACGYSKSESHSYTYKATKNPTASATGTLTGTCSKCSGTTTVTLPKLTTTDYTKTTTKAPTCTATGTDKYTWKTTTYGRFYFNVTTKEKGHTSVADKAVDPTCTATGLTEGKRCSVCNEVLTAQEVIPATGHTPVYTTKNADIHVITCENCDYVAEEAHNYVDGLCICGQVEVKEPVQNTTWKMGHTLNLASDISVNLAVSKSLLAGYDMETVYVLAEVDTYEGNEKTGTKIIKIEPVEQGSYYYFTLTGLTAVHMNDRIRSVLYGTKDGQPFFSETDDYSITDYAYSQMNKAGMPQSLKILCADLLRYGAKAQIFKAYRTDNPADAAMTEAQKAFLSDIETVIFGNANTVLDDLSSTTVTWAGKALDLNSKVTLKFIINPTNYKGNIDDLTLRLTFTAINGETKMVILENTELYNAERNYYAFSFDGFLAAELRTVISAQVYEGNTPVSATLQYSADTYGNNKTGPLGDLCKALVAYSDSARRYFIGP